MAYARPVCQGGADVREGLQQIDMIEEGVSETLRRVWKVSPRIFEDFLKIG